MSETVTVFASFPKLAMICAAVNVGLGVVVGLFVGSVSFSSTCVFDFARSTLWSSLLDGAIPERTRSTKNEITLFLLLVLYPHLPFTIFQKGGKIDSPASRQSLT